MEVAEGCEGLSLIENHSHYDVRALAGGVAGAVAMAPLLDAVLAGLTRGAAERDGPIPAGGPAAVRAAVGLCSQEAQSNRNPVAVLTELTAVLARGAADPADPRCAGHLHCPPLAVAVAAEVAVAALNQSLDSWDQAPSATVIEQHVIATLAGLAGYGASAGGVMTSGGTESNLMGLLLARESRPGRTRILCSAGAHFSIQRNAGLLGLGEDAVIAVPVDAAQRMDLAAARELIGPDVAAVVATAGTTDFGAIDPLPELAELAAAHGAWLHVDAAYGGGALFSERLAPLLDRPRPRRLRRSRPAQAGLAAGTGRDLPHAGRRDVRANGPPGRLPQPGGRRGGRLRQPARPVAAHHPPRGRVQGRGDAANPRPRAGWASWWTRATTWPGTPPNGSRRIPAWSWRRIRCSPAPSSATVQLPLVTTAIG